jgi:vancomycin resistance protein YoaR
MIEPGATVSFNEVVGPRSAARGSLEAPVYMNRRVESGLGGGICQVSTTLYNTALLGGWRGIRV